MILRKKRRSRRGEKREKVKAKQDSRIRSSDERGYQVLPDEVVRRKERWTMEKDR